MGRTVCVRAQAKSRRVPQRRFRRLGSPARPVGRRLSGADGGRTNEGAARPIRCIALRGLAASNRRGRGPTNGPLPDQALAVTKIGSGSDHTVFINHVGLPVVEMAFDGPYGVYHSAYDSHYWVETIGDPGFRYHQLMTELWGSMALRLANAEVLPLRSRVVRGLGPRVRPPAERHTGAADRLELSPLVKAVRALAHGRPAVQWATGDGAGVGRAAARGSRPRQPRLLQFEQGWLHEEGIPGRPWFKHLLYAPRYTYAAMTLPGITEAAEQGDWARAAAATLAGRECDRAQHGARRRPDRRPAVRPGRERRWSRDCGRCVTKSMGAWRSTSRTSRPASAWRSMPIRRTRPSASSRCR